MVVREGGVLRVQVRLAAGLAPSSVSADSPSEAGVVVDDGDLPSSSSGSFVPPPSEHIVSLSVLVNVRHSVSIAVLLNAGLKEGEHSLTRVSLLLRGGCQGRLMTLPSGVRVAGCAHRCVLVTQKSHAWLLKQASQQIVSGPGCPKQGQDSKEESRQ